MAIDPVPGQVKLAKDMTPAELQASRRKMMGNAAKLGEDIGMRRFWRDAKKQNPSLNVPEEYAS